MRPPHSRYARVWQASSAGDGGAGTDSGAAGGGGASDEAQRKDEKPVVDVEGALRLLAQLWGVVADGSSVKELESYVRISIVCCLPRPAQWPASSAANAACLRRTTATST